MVCFFKPAPKYRVGALVMYVNREQCTRYLLIRARRWLCPIGKNDKRWVYDGTVLCVQHGELIVFETYVSNVSEERLKLITGMR